MLISWTLVYRFFFFYLWTAAQLDCVYVCVSHFPAPGRHRDIYVGVCLFKTAGVTNEHIRARTHTSDTCSRRGNWWLQSVFDIQAGGGGGWWRLLAEEVRSRGRLSMLLSAWSAEIRAPVDPAADETYLQSSWFTRPVALCAASLRDASEQSWLRLHVLSRKERKKNTQVEMGKRQ